MDYTEKIEKLSNETREIIFDVLETNSLLRLIDTLIHDPSILLSDIQANSTNFNGELEELLFSIKAHNKVVQEKINSLHERLEDNVYSELKKELENE